MKRWLSVLLTLCLCVGLMLPAAAADTEDVTVPTDYWTDEGNYKEPSINAETRTVSITSAAELAWVAYRCMHGTTFAEYTILLENDIDLSGHLWMPIGGRDQDGNGGYNTTAFAGVFDGQGHSITGLTIYDTSTDLSRYHALFGSISSATIQNLLVVGANITAHVCCGILVGNVSSDSATLLNCGVTGTVNAQFSNNVGVLIGNGICNVYNCFANSRVTFEGRELLAPVFGRLGRNNTDKIVNCWWSADTLSQEADNAFKNCYTIPANNTVDYAEKLNDVMIEGAAKWVMGEDGYPTLDFNNRVQNWIDVAEPVTPVDGVYYIDKPEQLAYIAKIVNEGNTLEGQTVLLRNDLDLSGKSWVPIGFWTNYNNQTNFFGELNGNHKTISGLTIPFNSAAYKNGLTGLLGFGTYKSYIHDLTLNGNVFSIGTSCGLLGGELYGKVERCIVSGTIQNISTAGDAAVGGIAGRITLATQCSADVTIVSKGCSGAIAAFGAPIRNYEDNFFVDPKITECYSSGSITGSTAAGILGTSADSGIIIQNCYSKASLTAVKSTGYQETAAGIIGTMPSYHSEVQNCYFVGSMDGIASNRMGLIAGYYNLRDGDTIPIKSCYWSKECNMTIDGLPASKRGVGTDVSEDPTTGLTLTEMRTKASYAGWDFDTIWAIGTNKNGGLPYLRWQDDVPTVIEPTSLTLSAETVTLAAGRSTTLTAVFSPIGAGGKPTWSSDAPDVASVTAGGQVAAHRAGTAIITASYGSLQASCSVTVTERSSDEYTIREITLKDASGKAVTGIPSDSFWAYVSVTKGANAKDATVLLASYDRNGQYLGLTALEADVPCGTTYRLGAWFANADRRVAKVKAFVVDGVGTMRPLAAAAEIS